MNTVRQYVYAYVYIRIHTDTHIYIRIHILFSSFEKALRGCKGLEASGSRSRLKS